MFSFLTSTLFYYGRINYIVELMSKINRLRNRVYNGFFLIYVHRICNERIVGLLLSISIST